MFNKGKIGHTKMVANFLLLHFINLMNRAILVIMISLLKITLNESQTDDELMELSGE